MTTYLGLDLGTASLGWSLIEFDVSSSDQNRIVASGTRIFPEALEGTGGNKQPKNVARRGFRLARRQTRRRSRRKDDIKKILHGAGMLPGHQPDVLEGEQSCPYELREKASHARIELDELGRVLFHLSRRIGFGGSPKKSLDQFETQEEKDQAKEEKDYEEKAGNLAKNIGDKTLGSYLSTQPIKRNHHLNRKMVEDEFDVIWTEQQKHYPDILSNDLRGSLKNTVFFRNPIFWRWKTLGKCDLEPESRLLMRSEWLAQEFIMRQDINNLKLATRNPQPPDETERKILIELFRRNPKVTFAKMRAALKEHWQESGTALDTKFNFETGGDTRPNLSGNAVDAMLYKTFGEEVFERPDLDAMRKELPELKWGVEYHVDYKGFHPEYKSKRVEIKTGDQIKQSSEEFIQTVKTRWHVTDDQAETLLDSNLPGGWTRLSEKAIEKLLAQMSEGKPMEGKPMNEVMNYLYPREERLLGENLDELPSHHKALPDIRNPVVTRCLNETRKVVNNIIRTYGKPDYIRVEMARDVKLAGKKKTDALKINRDRRGKRDKAKKFLEENSIPINDWSVLKYVLWQETGERDVYSGDPISCDDLFRHGRYQIEHIMPRSRSLDDSLNNLLLCREDLNKQKSDRTPYEAFGDTDKWDEMEARLDSLDVPPAKQKRFLRKEYDEDPDDNRRNQQLVDTGYATTAARDFLACLYPKGEAIDWARGRPPRVQATNGRITSQLGQAWNLYKHFNTWFFDKDKNMKIRDDHRHHALDATIVALTTPGRVTKLAGRYNEFRKNGACYEDIMTEKLKFNPPWANFYKELKECFGNMTVSYRVDSKTTGQLTGQLQLGSRINNHGECEYVQRVRLATMTPGQFLKIRDEKVQSFIWAKLVENWENSRGNKPALDANYTQELKTKSGWKKDSPIKDAFKDAFKTEASLPRMPSKNGVGHLIKSARVTVGGEDFPTVKANTPKSAYATGDNHHIALYQKDDGSVIHQAVSKIEARRRVNENLPIIQNSYDGMPLLCALHKQDMLEKTDPETGEVTYYRIEIIMTEKQMIIRLHTDATEKTKESPSYATFCKNGYRKIAVDPLGRIKPSK